MFGKKILSRKQWSEWYAKWERPLSATALLSGFVFDIVTLKRVDQFLENMWVLGHLVIVALGILLLNIYKRGEGKNQAKEAVPGRIAFWLILAIQFTFGGLLSTYLVFYFRSATFASSWPFLLMLGLAFISNEAFKKHYERLSFQISILFLSIYSFAIFFVPILMHRIGPDVFILSGLASLAAILLFIGLLWVVTRERFRKSKNILFSSISVLFIIVNGLYFTNLIPPIPLSLKDAGVYHSISRDSSGNFVLASEQDNAPFEERVKNFFTQYELFHMQAGRTVYAFSAVFSPTDLNTDIIHNWQHYDEAKKEWVSITRITLSIIGGRDGGYRTYSHITDPIAGLWRVDVETPNGQDIGRIKFEVVAAK